MNNSEDACQSGSASYVSGLGSTIHLAEDHIRCIMPNVAKSLFLYWMLKMIPAAHFDNKVVLSYCFWS